MPKVNGILETALYVEEIINSISFYQSIFNFEVIVRDDRFCALNVSPGNVLLLFKKGGTRTPLVLPEGIIPPHDGEGQTHFAFSISKSSLLEWEQWLKEKGIPIESKIQWEKGGTSLYFRDPDQHLIELATPGLWTNY